MTDATGEAETPSGACASDGPLDGMFESFKEEVEKDRILKDEIAEVAHQLEYWALKIVASLQKTHSFKDEGRGCALAEVQSILDGQIQNYLAKLAAIISPLSYYRYHDTFRFVLQKLCFVVTYAHFLECGQLLNRDKVADALKLSIASSEGFHLDVEDYLFGVLQMASELSRFSINAVIAGDNQMPFKIAELLTELDGKFRLLNLKNDGLRRRYDALKYDVQRAEQVVYDLAIRGIKPT